MANPDFPSADHLDETAYLIRGPPNPVVLPKPPLALRYEQDVPLEGLAPDEDGHFCFSLPVFVRVEFFPVEDNAECFMLATKNKRSFDRGGDGLSVYGAVHRTDFSFRTRLFHGFPDNIQHNRVHLQQNEWNEMCLAVSEQQATYWINKVPVATCIFREGDLPEAPLYFGLTRFGHNYRFRRFDVSYDPIALSVFANRVMTLESTMEDSALRVRCLNISGTELATFEVAGATELFPGTQVNVARETVAFTCREQGDRFIYDSTQTVRLHVGPIGEVRSQFPDGSVALSVSSEYALERPRGGVCRRRATSDSRLFYLTADAAAGLQAQGGERLGEFRSRVAAHAGVLTHNLSLVLPDGSLLPNSRDAELLQAVLRPSD